jgi:hypothetical protein
MAMARSMWAFLLGVCALSLPVRSQAQERPAQAVRRGDVLIVPPVPRSSTEALAARLVLFVNGKGATYRSAQIDDAATNRSSIVASFGKNQLTVPAWSHGAASWKAMMACVAEGMRHFDIQVTDQDPGAVPHIELAVGGGLAQLGIQDSFWGIAPLSSDCSVATGGVGFVVSEDIGGVMGAAVAAEVCHVVLHEAGHALGLDHRWLCEDHMTYRQDCGNPRRFHDRAAPCGELDGPRACQCGATQNSVQHLRTVLGASQRDRRPHAALEMPRDGGAVAPGFPIRALVSDDRPVEKVLFQIDGQTIGEVRGEPWQLQAPADLAPGAHTVKITVSDAGGNSTSDEVRVQIGSGADTADSAQTSGDGAPLRVSGGCNTLPVGASRPLWPVLLPGVLLCGRARRRAGVRTAGWGRFPAAERRARRLVAGLLLLVGCGPAAGTAARSQDPAGAPQGSDTGPATDGGASGTDELERNLPGSGGPRFCSRILDLGNDGTVDGRVDRTYDAGDHLVLEEEDLDGDGTPEFRTTFSRDASGRPTQIELRAADGSRCYHRIEYVHGDGPAAAEASTDQRCDGSVEYRTTYQYSKGRLQSYEVASGEGIALRVTIERDARGNSIAEREDLDGDGMPDQISTYEHDEDGRLRAARWDNEADGTTDAQYVVSRDGDGQLRLALEDIDGDGIHDRLRRYTQGDCQGAASAAFVPAPLELASAPLADDPGPVPEALARRGAPF